MFASRATAVGQVARARAQLPSARDLALHSLLAQVFEFCFLFFFPPLKQMLTCRQTGQTRL